MSKMEKLRQPTSSSNDPSTTEATNTLGRKVLEKVNRRYEPRIDWLSLAYVGAIMFLLGLMVDMTFGVCP